MFASVICQRVRGADALSFHNKSFSNNIGNRASLREWHIILSSLLVVDRLYRSKQKKSVPPCVILLRQHSGRLSNRLLMLATAFGLTLTHDCHLIISPPIGEELEQTFDLNLSRSLIISRIWLTIQRISSDHTRWILANLPIFYRLCSFHSATAAFQTIDCSSCADVLRYSTDQFDSYRHSCSAWWFFPVRKISSDLYIWAAMAYFAQKYPSALFIIATDDRSYCQKTLCDHLIITVGTFGWWTAFLLYNQQGEMITDANEDHGPIDVSCSSENYFPPSFSFLNQNRLKVIVSRWSSSNLGWSSSSSSLLFFCSFSHG